METLLDIADALPENFNFYHLGRVEAQTVLEASDVTGAIADSDAVAFTLQGDRRATVIILFEKGLDQSMYAEMGNVMVSRLASTLSETGEIDVIISPPKNLASNMVHSLVKMAPIIQVRNYLHVGPDTNVRVQALILSENDGKIAHA